MKQKNFFNFYNYRQFFLIFTMGFAGLFLLMHLVDSSRVIRPIGYSTFLKNVELDKVKSVQVSGQRASGKLTDGTQFETIVPGSNSQQWDLLRQHNVEFSLNEDAQSTPGWYWLFFVGLILFGVLIWFLMRQSRGGNGSGNTIFNIGKSRAKMIMPTQVKTTFADVAGAGDAKQELTDIVEFLKHPEKFKRLGAKLPRGVLLVGEPGNGKTLLAKAVAGEANCPFFMVSGSDFVEVFVGVGAARIRDLFAQARKHVPCIVFIDEIDAIGRQRGTGLGGGNDEREQTLNQLLTEMDGFETQNAPIIVIAATNIPDVLDRALLRPGRFDRRIEVPFPDANDREEVLKIHTRKIKLSPDIDLKIIAQETASFSGADLANLINLAALSASKKNHRVVMPEDIEEAREKIFKSQDTQNATSSAQNRGAGHAKLFMPQQVKIKFADVAGAKEAKEEVADVVEFLITPEKFKRLGARVPRGVLLSGEPGNGKTLLAKAIAGEANRPFFSVSGSDFVEQYVGVGASRVRELFTQARKHSPCIVFIDEIDSIGTKRSTDGSGGSREHDQTLNQLLTEMDGFNSMSSDVIVIGATNRIDMLDKALLRPGRFDRQVVIPYPDITARKEILQVHARKLIMDPAVDLHVIARGTTGFSGADLANLLNEAALFASKANKDFVGAEELNEARDKIIMGKAMKSIIMSPKEIQTVAVHEAGHALIPLLMPDLTEPLFKITIVPRSSSLGSTHWLPEREKYLSSKEEMLARIQVALAGRIAEEIVFNTQSNGAYGDFTSATNIANDMVRYYGMSDTLGTVIYGRPSYGEQRYSEETARKIDQEVQRIIQTCYDQTRDLINKNRDKLDKLAALLIEKETVQADEVYACLGIEPRPTPST